MKFLKYLLLLVVIVVAGALIYAYMQPSEYNVSRSKTINAPVATVFSTINELKTWEKWGPWNDEDTTIVVTYGDKTSGVGANYSWVGKDSPGNMKTVNVVPNKLIEQKMQFEDFKPSDVIWKFEEQGDATKVTWQMKENDAPFVFKLASAFTGGWDKMLGTMQENGLENLDELILEEVKLANSFTISDVIPKELEAKTFIGYPVKMKIDHEEMTRVFTEKMPKAGIYAANSGLDYNDYTPAAVYTKYDEETQETEFLIGLILQTDLAPAEGMESIDLPAGKAVMVSKFGNYGNGDEDAHIKIASYLEENNLKQKWPLWEIYVNDPTLVKPQDIQTDIYYPVQE